MAHRNLLDREAAQKATKKLDGMNFISPKMPLKNFIESNLENFQRILQSGSTKREIYNFLCSEFDLDLGSFENFKVAWRKCARKVSQQEGTHPESPTIRPTLQTTTTRESQQRKEERIEDTTSDSKPKETEVPVQPRSAELPRETAYGREIIMKNGYRTFEI